MKKKEKIPSNPVLYRRRTQYLERRDPIWVVLENEMREKANRGIKPYNEKVGDWLKFLKALIRHYYTTEKRQYRKLGIEIGAPWYIEFSQYQRDVLRGLKFAIHQDVFENRPTRTKKSLKELGFTIDFSKEMLMEAMALSVEDTGIFFWELYKMYYEKSPSELLPRYDANAQRMMSALVFADLEECRKELIRITAKRAPKPAPPPKKKSTYTEPKVKYGVYLQKMTVPCCSSHPDKLPKPKKPLPIKNKIKLRTKESYENLMKADDFLELRKERNRLSEPKPRICNYKFWKAPETLRNKDPNLAAYIAKMKMFSARPKKTFLKHKPNIEILHNHIKGVSYLPTGRAVYHLDNLTNQNTGYVPINGGLVCINGEYVTNVLGFFKCPRDTDVTCVEKCDCETKWDTVIEHLEDSTCTCNHLYDFMDQSKIEGKKHKYFHPPKGLSPYCIDEPKLYELDDWEGFIKQSIQQALDSYSMSGSGSTESISPAKLKEKDLLAAFLADLSNKPLIIPHLPKAELIKDLQELVRQRVKGDLKKPMHKKLLLKSKRKWVNLDHVDHTSRAYRIPFTEKEINNLNFSHKNRLQTLNDKLTRNFTKRTVDLWREHTRIFWNTMEFPKYQDKSFLDCFFTYMPVRDADMYVINPFNKGITPKCAGKTCPLPDDVRRRWPESVGIIPKKSLYS
ncbi:hypothetical protein NE865_03635 [Phthorimaea operculella]|nr:hypothetical protein NE865_03635 [Phthorimaea operculella]